MRVKQASLAVMMLLGLGGAYCAAQDFSADVLYSSSDHPTAASGAVPTPSHKPSKLYVSSHNMRLETRGMNGAILVVNEEKEGMFALFPAQKEYEPLDGGLSEYFRVADAENACPDWEKAATTKVNCEKAGDETVDGRKTVHYRNRGASDNEISSVWIDVNLKFVIKWEGAGSVVELHDIAEGTQPADLFTLPPDYQAARPRKGNGKGFSSR